MDALITNPNAIDPIQIHRILDSGRVPTLQFSEPIYTRDTLGQINRLCLTLKEKIKIRFFGYYQSEFDAQVLTDIPDVVDLSLDCLRKIKNVQCISDLKKISRFSFGVFEFDLPEVLGILPLEQLEQLSIHENRKRNLNLGLLVSCKQLQKLYVEGHTKKAETISQLPKLTHLTLRAFSKNASLKFLSECEKLKSLILILGGRQNLDEFAHPRLEDLSVIRVKGLEDLGPMSRFPRLKNLVVEDQLQLLEIDVSDTDIIELKIGNCKNLCQVKGLSNLVNLKTFWIYKTNLPLEKLLHFKWPKSLENLGLYSQSQTWNAKFNEISTALGYRTKS